MDAGGTHLGDLGQDGRIVADLANDVGHGLASLNSPELFSHVKCVAEPALSKRHHLICDSLVLHVDPALDLLVHVGLSSDLDQLLPQVVKILEGKVGPEGAFQEEWMCSGLPKTGEIRQVRAHLFVCNSGLDVRAHVVPETALEATVSTASISTGTKRKGYSERDEPVDEPLLNAQVNPDHFGLMRQRYFENRGAEERVVNAPN